MRRITLEQLCKAGACDDQVAVFEALFGDGVEATPPRCRAHAHMFSFEWAAKRLLSPPALIKYESAAVAARLEYEEASDAAFDKYKLVAITAGTKYVEACTIAFPKYEKARALAKTKYKEAIALAFCDAYNADTK